MTAAENLDYRNVFYRRGSTMPEWFDPSATDVPLFLQFSQYDDIPVAWRDSPKNSPNPRNRSMKNLSPKRFVKAKAKAKIAKESRKRNRKK
jgi:hypothetical protein